MRKIGVYIHVPFCTEKCPYCDFYSMSGAFASMDAYTEAVVRTLQSYADSQLSADTIYFGGGTPSLLGAARIAKMIETVKTEFGFRDGEVTVEVNPTAQEVWLANLMEGLAGAGVNRVSIGLQSANVPELSWLGRRHSPEQARKAVQLAQQAGIWNVSLDVMLAVPGQTVDSLRRTLAFCAESGAQHVSAYLLKLEPGTAFYAKQETLRPLLPDEDQEAELYLTAVEELERFGYEQYEISNFARRKNGVLLTGRHNQKYWNGEEYLGVGPAAHSYLYGKRFYYPRDLQGFLQGCDAVPDGEGGSREEFAMLRLRLSEGLTERIWQTRFGEALPTVYLRRAKKFVPPGLIRLSACEPGFSLTPKGFLLSNALIAEILFGT